MHAATPWGFPLTTGCRAALPEAMLPVVHQWFPRERDQADSTGRHQGLAHFRPVCSVEAGFCAEYGPSERSEPSKDRDMGRAGSQEGGRAARSWRRRGPSGPMEKGPAQEPAGA